MKYQNTFRTVYYLLRLTHVQTILQTPPKITQVVFATNVVHRKKENRAFKTSTIPNGYLYKDFQPMIQALHRLDFLTWIPLTSMPENVQSLKSLRTYDGLSLPLVTQFHTSSRFCPFEQLQKDKPWSRLTGTTLLEFR